MCVQGAIDNDCMYRLLVQVYDDCALSASVKEEMYKCYPDAHRAHLKSGGNFPFLSRSVDVNIFLQVYCYTLT